jgi:hypothetical protein
MSTDAKPKLRPIYSRLCERPGCRRKVYRPMDSFCGKVCEVAEARRLRAEKAAK